eukprot:g4037.t1
MYHEAMVRWPLARKNEFEALVETARIGTPCPVILDIPSGGGYLASYLPGGARLISIDSASNFLESGNHAGEHQVICAPHDEVPLPDGAADVIVSLAGLHHIDDQEAVFAEWFRLLKPGGVLAIGDGKAGSSTARFLDGVVGRFNTMGHSGNYLRERHVGMLESVGFKVTEAEIKSYGWQFENRDEMLKYCRTLFCMDREPSDEELVRAIEDTEGDAFGLATSLTALREHPAYRSEIDPVGMLRYVIQNGSTGTRTLEVSGRRLSTACSIRYDSRSNRIELNQHRLPGPREGKKIQSEEEAITRSVEATRRAVERHMQRPPDHALLSGGLDSRHLLALAHEAGIRPLCGTGGVRSDYESIFASTVARRLGLEWCCEEDSVEALGKGVRDELRLHWLGGGFSTVTLNAGAALSRKLGKRSLGGLILDVHYSPVGSRRVARNLTNFEFALEKWINQAGVDPETLRRMCVDSTMRDALEMAIGEIRGEWDSFEGSGYDRIWKMILHFRARPHLGTHAWKQSFFTWPVLPNVDLPMAETIRGIADRHFIGRKLQRQTLARIAPDLARIPLATFSPSPEPIIPNFRSTLQRKYFGLRATLSGSRRDDYHRYHRAMNFDHAAWRKVREYAEPHRDSLHQFFKPEELNVYLPKPSVTTGFRNGGGRRFLCGMMLWNGMRGEA